MDPAGGSYDIVASEYNSSPPIPGDPSDLFSFQFVQAKVSLIWCNKSLIGCHFRVERFSNGIDFKEIATIGDTVTSYIDESISEPGMYYYRVAAVNEAGSSQYSNIDLIQVDEISAVSEKSSSHALKFYQFYNYPNPFETLPQKFVFTSLLVGQMRW